MAILTVMHWYQGLSGLAEDRFVNTWHVWADSASDDTQLAAIAEAFKEFYGPDGRTGFKLYMSNMASGGEGVSIYDVDDSPPRVPVYTWDTNVSAFGVITDKPIPHEVALCLSYEAIAASGTNPARRRGRVYIGPFNVQALPATTPTSVNGRPISSLRAAMLSQAVLLCSELNAVDAALVTYSPTSDAGGMTSIQSSKLVHNFWVDDAWDTQRRRGLAPSVREESLADQDPLVFLDL